MTPQPSYRGSPLKFDLSPVVIPRAIYSKTVSELSKLLSSIEAFTNEVKKQPRLLPKLGLPEDLNLAPTPVGLHIPFSRFDVALDTVTGEFRVFELNTDGTSGFNISQWLGDKANIPQDQNPNYDLSSKLLKAIQEHSQSSETIHLMDFRDVETSWEQQDLVERWKAQGAKVELSDPGQRTWRAGDLIYRRILSWQLRSQQQRCQPFLDDWKNGKITVVGSWSSDVGMSKAWPVFLSNSLALETIIVDDQNFQKLKLEKDSWVVKAALSYSGKSVFRGLDIQINRWESTLRGLIEETKNGRVWVAQKYFSIPLYEQKPLELGFYFLNGKPEGVMARWGHSEIISEDSQEILRPVQIL